MRDHTPNYKKRSKILVKQQKAGGPKGCSALTKNRTKKKKRSKQNEKKKKTKKQGGPRKTRGNY